jgi:hypothetical protein
MTSLVNVGRADEAGLVPPPLWCYSFFSSSSLADESEVFVVVVFSTESMLSVVECLVLSPSISCDPVAVDAVLLLSNNSACLERSSEG